MLLGAAAHHGTTLAARIATFAQLGAIAFPHGTYLLCRRYGLPCAAAP